MAGVFHFSFIHCRCEVVLGEFLKETKKNPSSVKFAEMANILVIHCQTTGEHVAALQTPSSSEAPSPRPGQSPGGCGRQCDGRSRARGLAEEILVLSAWRPFHLGALDGGRSGGLAGRLGISTVN